MGFQTISVKEAVNNINANSNGWFLPAVQRPYVWGSRYESEKYICKLFDSILNGYPIGTLIVWNTDKEVPYREVLAKKPELAFEEAVRRMLPSGVLGRKQLKNLVVYRGAEHNHEAQKPEVLELKY